MLSKHLYSNPFILLKNSDIFRFQTKKKKTYILAKLKMLLRKKIVNDCTTLNASMG